jgi:hypothetical protein
MLAIKVGLTAEYLRLEVGGKLENGKTGKQQWQTAMAKQHKP